MQAQGQGDLFACLCRFWLNDSIIVCVCVFFFIGFSVKGTKQKLPFGWFRALIYNCDVFFVSFRIVDTTIITFVNKGLHVFKMAERLIPTPSLVPQTLTRKFFKMKILNLLIKFFVRVKSKNITYLKIFLKLKFYYICSFGLKTNNFLLLIILKSYIFFLGFDFFVTTFRRTLSSLVAFSLKSSFCFPLVISLLSSSSKIKMILSSFSMKTLEGRMEADNGKREK